MKYRQAIYIGAALFWVLCVTAGPAAAEKRYGLESALIEYNISGHIQGTETAYIDDYGEKESRYSEYTLQLSGHDGVQKRFTLREDDFLTNVDLNKNLSVQFDLNKEISQGLSFTLTGKEMADYSNEGLQKMRAVKVGEETVAGKTCDLYELPFLKAKVWVYKNVALRYESSTRGFKVAYLATAIKEGVEISPDKFRIPDGVRNVGVVPENNIMGAVQPLPQK